MKRRHALMVVAALLIAANVIYFFVTRSEEPEEVTALWVAYMPGLEASQRANPVNFLDTSEFRDPRYPGLYLIEDGGAFPLFAKIASDCHVSEYAIQSYVASGDIDRPVQMPDRLFVGELESGQQSCVRAKLPEGYQLAKLARPVRPIRVGWNDGDLQLASAGSN